MVPYYNCTSPYSCGASLYSTLFIPSVNLLQKQTYYQFHLSTGFGDMDFSMKAYLSGVVSIFSQGLYLTFVQKLSIEKQHSALDILYINSVNCLPLFLIHAAVSREIQFAIQYLQSCPLEFYAIFLAVVCTGCVLNYSMFLCTTMNSALTTSIVGVVKSVVTTVVGMFSFGGVQPTLLILTGIFMNTVGGIWYTYLKYQEKLAKEELPK